MISGVLIERIWEGGCRIQSLVPSGDRSTIKEYNPELMKRKGCMSV